MADISGLTGLQAPEPLDLENYQDVKEFTPIPPKGRYTVQAPPSFPSTAFGVSKAGALTAQIDPTIVGPTNEGYTLRFTKVSAKVFKRNGIPVSQMGDYLRALGMRPKLTSNAELADAVEQTASRQYIVDVDWRAYNKNTGFSVEGMERFPLGKDGKPQPWVEDPNDVEKDESGNPVHDAQGNPVHVRLRANPTIVRFVAASN